MSLFITILLVAALILFVLAAVVAMTAAAALPIAYQASAWAGLAVLAGMCAALDETPVMASY